MGSKAIIDLPVVDGGTEKLNEAWIPATVPVDSIGAVRGTVRVRYPTGSDPVQVSKDGVVSIDIDDDTLHVNDSGILEVHHAPVMVQMEDSETNATAVDKLVFDGVTICRDADGVMFVEHGDAYLQDIAACVDSDGNPINKGKPYPNINGRSDCVWDAALSRDVAIRLNNDIMSANNKIAVLQNTIGTQNAEIQNQKDRITRLEQIVETLGTRV